MKSDSIMSVAPASVPVNNPHQNQTVGAGRDAGATDSFNAGGGFLQNFREPVHYADAHSGAPYLSALLLAFAGKI